MNEGSFIAHLISAVGHQKNLNTLQHTATHCNTLQHAATRCNTLQHAATHTYLKRGIEMNKSALIAHLIAVVGRRKDGDCFTSMLNFVALHICIYTCM